MLQYNRSPVTAGEPFLKWSNKTNRKQPRSSLFPFVVPLHSWLASAKFSPPGAEPRRIWLVRLNVYLQIVQPLVFCLVEARCGWALCWMYAWDKSRGFRGNAPSGVPGLNSPSMSFSEHKSCFVLWLPLVLSMISNNFLYAAKENQTHYARFK